MPSYDQMHNGSSPPAMDYSRKRLILCCDGTWMNSDSGYKKPTFFRPQGTLQDPSNVTRIARCFKRKCQDGKLQVVSYESGVGTGITSIDTIAGGVFGLGISERIREAYSFICANYCDGDEIILVGFSRGAFTVRSVAGMISQLGLLTREGIEHFYPIFKDMENWMTAHYEDPFPTLPFSDKPHGPNAAAEYKKRLLDLGYTRIRQQDGRGDPIKVKAVAVWDTVGSLGIPQFYDTSISKTIEHAFQALALDEHRPPFTPAVWERLPDNKLTTDLRQVWFPGNHANCGGGWPDQGVSNMTLAWMMDQLASIGCEFDTQAFDNIIQRTTEHYQTITPDEDDLPFAVDPIFTNNEPVRPWALGAIRKSTNGFYALAGTVDRTPGLYRQVDQDGRMRPGGPFLHDTNERVHSSVRVRLASRGLALDDADAWACEALRGSWRLTRRLEKFEDPIPRDPAWDPEPQLEMEPREGVDDGRERGWRWVWEYCGPEQTAPPAGEYGRVLVEETLGPYERYLLRRTAGRPNVFTWAEGQGVPYVFQ